MYTLRCIFLDHLLLELGVLVQFVSYLQQLLHHLFNLRILLLVGPPAKVHGGDAHPWVLGAYAANHESAIQDMQFILSRAFNFGGLLQVMKKTMKHQRGNNYTVPAPESRKYEGWSHAQGFPFY